MVNYELLMMMLIDILIIFNIFLWSNIFFIPGNLKIKIYPKIAYTVYRDSKEYARVAEPLPDVKLQKLYFRFEVDQNPEIFGITDDGIVYIKNTKLLKQFNQSQSTLKIIYGNDQIKIITLHFENLPDKQCKETSHCSNIHLDTKSECTSSCGIGCIFKCQWRESSKPDMITVNYSTCTPDTKTCPDGYCDNLEKIDYLICPQDCTNKVFGTGSKSKNGILRAKGVCTCDEIGKCTCETKMSDGRKNKNKSTPQTPINYEQDPCEYWCDNNVNMSIIIVITFALIGIVMYCCRNRIFWILGNNKTNRNVRTLEELLPPCDQNIIHQPNIIPNRDNLIHNTDFDPKWEFPRNRLILEKVIGEGAFGKVLKAQAMDIPGKKGMSTVAVKTIKQNAGSTEKNDLLSEYNLLKYVNHPNVVKLLGACTTQDGPFYLIIEFAKYGSLKSYLRKSRILNTNIDGLISNTEHFQQNESMTSSTLSIYPINPKDILTFSWQISKGMTYLAELKLVHRDLAARNILVTKDKVCKVSDFGLTRDVYEDNAYLKKTRGRVPVKWMAPESLSDNIYTSKSDIWSFGIVLWELVTLGTDPYPGIDAKDLFKLLNEGYRMDKPNNCSTELYNIMNSCWTEDPYRRPSFKSLTTSLEEMLEKGNDYLKLEFNQIVNNMCYLMNDKESTNQNKNTIENTEEEVKYKIPKSHKEIGMTYVAMKDFIIDQRKNTKIV